MSEFKRGDIVTIYEDPFTGKKVEGKAHLVSLIAEHKTDGSQYWEVKFLFESGTYRRWVVPGVTKKER